MTNIHALNILYRNRICIITIVIIVVIISFLVGTFMPQAYRASTTILPPLEEEGMFNFASLMSDLPLKALGLGSVSSGTELFMAILQSRTILDSAIAQFHLIDRYDAKNNEEALKTLKKHVFVNLDDEGTITFVSEAETPWFSGKTKKDEARLLARDMANYFIVELDRINRNLRSERGRNTRIYIEKRYQQNLDDLRTAEEALRVFQKENGILLLPEQTQATINTAASLKAEVLAKEVQLEISRKTIGEANPQSIQFKDELDVLRNKYKQFTFGKEDDKYFHDGSVNDLFLSFKDVPDLGMQYVRLYREMLLQEKLLEFTLPQYEQARIQELKDTPTLQVLDKAVAPIKKYRPKRIIGMVFYGFLSFLLISTYLIYKPVVILYINEIKQSP